MSRAGSSFAPKKASVPLQSTWLLTWTTRGSVTVRLLLRLGGLGAQPWRIHEAEQPPGRVDCPHKRDADGPTPSTEVPTAAIRLLAAESRLRGLLYFSASPSPVTSFTSTRSASENPIELSEPRLIQ